MMNRIFKFFGENNTFSWPLPVSIEPSTELMFPWPRYNTISYPSDDPNRAFPNTPISFMFEWVNQYEHRELEISRLETFSGIINDFPFWYDDLMDLNIGDSEYLPEYPPIYEIRTNHNTRIYRDGDFNIPNPTVLNYIEIDVKIYLR